MLEFILSFALAGCSSGVEPEPEDFQAQTALSTGEDLLVAGAGEEIGLLGKDKLERLKVAPGIVRMRQQNGKIYALVTGRESSLLTLDPKTLKIDSRIPCGHFAADFVLRGSQVLLSHSYSDLIRCLDLAGEEVWCRELPREPGPLVLSPDGQDLWVATRLPSQAATAPLTACRIVRIDPRDGAIRDSLDLPDGSTGLKEMIASADGKRLYCSFVLARNRVPATQLSRGWVNTNALGIVDCASRKITVVLLDDIDRGAANPWGLAQAGGRIAVSLSGTQELLLIDEAAMLKKIAAVPEAERPALANQLSFLHSCSIRRPLKTEGARAVVAHQGGFVSLGYFSNSLQRLSLQGEPGGETRLGPAASSAARLGEALFHDARAGYQTWQSCASCHPGGRVDGLAWDRPYDFGHARKTKSLFGAHLTAPSSITAVRADARASSRAAFEFNGLVPREAQLDQIGAYFASLQPLPSPRLGADGSLSPLARRGREIFESASCIDCHSGELFTCRKMKDIGTGLGDEAGRKFDVPSLREVWRNASYLHDGRAATLESIFKEHNAAKKHGDAHELNEADFAALMEYLRSL
ncbi:MAG: hypothetical protein RL095_2091 [Verrucomicrobiota bacterium]|jgi:mono/diheme cytochrome c family protein